MSPERHAARGTGLGRLVGCAALSTALPGAGLLAAGRRRAGAVVLGVVALALVAGAVLLGSGRARDLATRVAVEPRSLTIVAVATAVGAALWCLVIVATAVVARPHRLPPARRALAVLLVAGLCALVALPGAVVTRYTLIQRDLVTSVFHDGGPTPGQPAQAAPLGAADPWAGMPRVNVLLVGGDAGTGRTGLRPDSLLVASVDTRTGDTVLFSLPRNLQDVPFPASNPLHRVYPRGYSCGDACLLNAVWEEAEGRRDLFPGDPQPGLTTTRAVVGEVLGLRIDYYALLDLRGFERVVSALGGVTVDVERRIPIGGGKNQYTGAPLPITGYIEPGRQHLDGHDALWYARSREGSDDYDRMRRQRCLIGDLIDQTDPVRLVRAFPALAASARTSIATDVPRRDLPAWVQLAFRVKSGTVSSLPFTSSVISSASPDFPRIRTLVRKAIDQQERSAKEPSSRPSASTRPDASTSPSPSASPSDAPRATELAAVC